MKYLKTFEAKKRSEGHYVDESTIKYILMDITDNGYKVQINNMNDASKGNQNDRKYIITIFKNGGIDFDEIEPVIEHLSNYMRTEGYIDMKDKKRQILDMSGSMRRTKSHIKDRIFLEYKFSALALLKSKKKS